MQILFILVLIIIVYLLLKGIRRNKISKIWEALPASNKILLEQHVAFYRALSASEKKTF